LTAETRPDVLKLVPASPKADDPQDKADQATFRATRSLEGSPRWAMALADNTITQPAVMKGFQCALGIGLTAENAPKTLALLRKANIDTGAAANLLKNTFKRKRPFETMEGAVCLSANDAANLAKGSPDYPSGHSTYGWTLGLILAELMPDRATAILGRARAFGDSRTVCGVHSVSAVNAGRQTATVVLTAMHGVAAFRTDMDAARAELEALRAQPVPEAEWCPLERTTLAGSPDLP
jgi:acid phosphatase (class A)